MKKIRESFEALFLFVQIPFLGCLENIKQFRKGVNKSEKETHPRTA
jgi:hypothetical protein